MPRLVLPPDRAPEPVLRPARPADDDFLLRVYASTRADELDLVEWGPGQRDAFERMQFDAQRRDWSARFPEAQHLVIEVDGTDVGRFVLDEGDELVLLLHLALLPSVRGRGIGSVVLQDALARADERGLPARLHVDPGNRARRLYVRLGFEVVGHGSDRLVMERAGRR